MEIVVNYSIGDESTDLQIFYYDNLVKLNVSPQVIPVPVWQIRRAQNFLSENETYPILS